MTGFRFEVGAIVRHRFGAELLITEQRLQGGLPNYSCRTRELAVGVFLECELEPLEGPELLEAMRVAREALEREGFHEEVGRLDALLVGIMKRSR